MPKLFQIKICGVTRPADADVVANSGADAIGLNFFAGSKRYVAPATAREITARLPASVTKVGVFVNAEIDSIQTIANDLSLDWIQLHGDETPEILAQIHGLPIIKAFRLTESGLNPALEFLQECRTLGCLPAAVLLDAYHPTEFGGTGLTMDWHRLSEQTALMGGMQWVLAGGLTPSNVATAIDQAQPSAVDTASGVETCVGRKDAALASSFVERARLAFQQSG